MKLENEFKFAEENFTRTARNKQKGLPKTQPSNFKYDFATMFPSTNITFYYDIDAIIATGHILDLDNFARNDLVIAPVNNKIKSDDIVFKSGDFKFKVKELKSYHFGHISLPNSLKLDFWLLTPREIRIGLYLNKIVKNYKNAVQQKKGFGFSLYSFNNPSGNAVGIVDKRNLIYLAESIMEVIGQDTFFHFEKFGTKKYFHAESLQLLLGMVIPYFNYDFSTLIVDISYNISTSCTDVAIFPTELFLYSFGTLPNYFTFFSLSCVNVNRKVNFYENKNEFIRLHQIIKTNFYSSIQDCFNAIVTRKFYPEAAKGLLIDILRGDANSTGYNLINYKEKIEVLKKIINVFEKFDYKTVLNYRMEFRMPFNKVESFTNGFSKHIRENNFKFIKTRDLIGIILQNLNSIFDCFDLNPTSIFKVAEVVFLETLFISTYLRGDIFKLPFSTCTSRKAQKLFLFERLGKVNINSIRETVSNLDIKTITLEFIKSLNFLSEDEREICNWLFDLSSIFYIKELFFLEIKASIAIQKERQGKFFHYNKIQPRDFFSEIYYKNLENHDPVRLLIPIYKHLYPNDDIFELLSEDLSSIYYEKFDVIFKFNRNLMYWGDMVNLKGHYIDFFKSLKKTKMSWAENEEEELIFGCSKFRISNSKVALEDLLNNFAFSFHITRSRIALERKINRIDLNNLNDLKIWPLKDRFLRIEKQLGLKLSNKFKDDYKRLVMNDLLSAGLINV